MQDSYAAIYKQLQGWRATLTGRLIECVSRTDNIPKAFESFPINQFLFFITASLREFASDVVVPIMLRVSPNPPKDRDGRREDSGRG